METNYTIYLPLGSPTRFARRLKWIDTALFHWSYDIQVGDRKPDMPYLNITSPCYDSARGISRNMEKQTKPEFKFSKFVQYYLHLSGNTKAHEAMEERVMNIT